MKVRADLFAFDGPDLAYKNIREAFGDLSELPNDVASAGLVLQETTRDIDEIYNDFDRCAIKLTRALKEVRS